MPPNFSAVYGLLFCAGVYFSGNVKWWAPLGVVFLTDLALGFYYHTRIGSPILSLYLVVNYLGYLGILGIARFFRPHHSLWRLIGGSLVGAILFYLITNTAAWFWNPFRNPEYTRDLMGWIIALTKGTSGYPETWQFFRNTLLSSGLFTALFAGAWKWVEAQEPEEEEEEEEAPAPASSDSEPEPEAEPAQ